MNTLRGKKMNGYGCGRCGHGSCVCEERENQKILRDTESGKTSAEVGVDVFSKVGRRRMKIIKWIWPDVKRLADALYDYWDKA